MREWKGANLAAFDGDQRHAMDAIDVQLAELTAAIKLLAEGRRPTQGGTEVVPTPS